MGFEYNELRGRIVAKFGTLGNFADFMGVSQETISKKLNNKVAITQKEIRDWSNKLGIENKDIGMIFFNQKVQND